MTEQVATFTLRRTLSGKRVKAWRTAHMLSARELALELGVSRQYIKSIEGGSLEASQKLIKRFDALCARLGEAVAVEPPHTVNVESKFALPESFEILAKPRRCAGCRKWFIPVTPNQRMHTNDACKRLVRSAKQRLGTNRARRRKGATR